MQLSHVRLARCVLSVYSNRRRRRHPSPMLAYGSWCSRDFQCSLVTNDVVSDIFTSVLAAAPAHACAGHRDAMLENEDLVDRTLKRFKSTFPLSGATGDANIVVQHVTEMRAKNWKGRGSAREYECDWILSSYPFKTSNLCPHMRLTRH